MSTDANAGPLAELEAMLGREIRLHSPMLELAEKKRVAVIQGDLPGLEAILAEERKLVAEAEAGAAAREAALRTARVAVGLPETEGRLEDIVARLPEPERSRIGEEREKLRSLLDELRKKSRHNAELLKASLAHVEAFLRAVADAARADKPYGKDGRPTGGGGAFLDRDA